MNVILPDNSMKLFFLIAPCLYLVNIVVSWLFVRKYKDEIYKRNLTVWVCYLLLGISQGISNELLDISVFYKALLWTVFVFAGLEAMASCIAEMYKTHNNIKRDFKLYIGSVVLSMLLYNTIENINLSVLPMVFFSAWPVIKFLPLIKLVREKNFTVNGYFLCSLVTAIHILDYAYAVDKPALIFPGYLVALILAMGMSCCSYAMLVERAIMEVQIKDLLQNTARLTALGAMAAEISHEIKNPLTVLTLNNAQMKQKIINSTYAESNEAQYLVNKTEIAERMLKRLVDILNTLRSHYNSGALDDFKQVKVKEIFEEVNLICAFRAQKLGVKVNFQTIDPSTVVECRFVQVVQALQNIIQNGIDALDKTPNPTIDVEVKMAEDNRVQLIVKDNGSGVPEDIKSKIFDSFFTTKNHEKGSGLGLSISRRFIEDNGGKLYLEEGLPTRFVIELPVSRILKNSQRQIKDGALGS